MTRRPIIWVACLILAAVAGAVWGQLPHLDSAPLLRVALFATLGFLCLPLCFLFPDTDRRRATMILVAGAVLLRLALLPAPVSDDVNRYLWEGRLTLAGENPFAATADDLMREAYRDEYWAAMNHRDRPTAYPPGIQWIMAGAVAITYHPFSMKALALIGDLLCLGLVLRLLEKRAAPVRWAGFYAFNPLILVAFAAEAHFDSLMVVAILAMLLADHHRRPALVWLFLGLAIQIKPVAIVLVPLLVTRSNLRGAWAIIPMLILPTLPFLSEIGRWWEGVTRFAGGGAFNGPMFTVLSLLGFPPEPARFTGIAVFGLAGMYIFLASLRGLPLIRAASLMLGALLVCSPVVHFWYLAWVLPFAALRPSFALTTASVTMAGYFLAWHTQDIHGWWGFGHGTSALIWLLPLLAFLAQHRPCLGRLRRIFQAPDVEKTTSRLSIVVPALNVGPDLPRFISKLRASVPPAAEIILADGGSTDGSLDDIRETVVRSAPGRGQQIAAGIAASTGDWILIAHADTHPADGWHDRLQHAIRHHPQAAMLVLGQRFLPHSFPTLIIEALNELRVVFGGVAFGDQTMVVRRRALEACGDFPAQPLMEDVEVSLRLQAHGDIIYLGQEWQVSAKKWHKGFTRRLTLILRLMITYQIVRLSGRERAQQFSQKLYAEYYPRPEKAADRKIRC
ncbi:MAG: glycosyltransferase [Luteolibacter sp.]